MPSGGELASLPSWLTATGQRACPPAAARAGGQVRRATFWQVLAVLGTVYYAQGLANSGKTCYNGSGPFGSRETQWRSRETHVAARVALEAGRKVPTEVRRNAYSGMQSAEGALQQSGPVRCDKHLTSPKVTTGYAAMTLR